jgi:hypothetical protein
MESKDMIWTARHKATRLIAQAIDHNPCQLAKRLIADDPWWAKGMVIRLEPKMEDCRFSPNGLAIALSKI